MNEQRGVETVEEFKLRIAAIIGGKPEQITGAPRPDPLLVCRKKGCDSPESKTSKDPLARLATGRNFALPGVAVVLLVCANCSTRSRSHDAVNRPVIITGASGAALSLGNSGPAPPPVSVAIAVVWVASIAVAVAIPVTIWVTVTVISVRIAPAPTRAPTPPGKAKTTNKDEVIVIVPIAVPVIPVIPIAATPIMTAPVSATPVVPVSATPITTAPVSAAPVVPVPSSQVTAVPCASAATEMAAAEARATRVPAATAVRCCHRQGCTQHHGR